MYCTRVFSTLSNILDIWMLHNDIIAGSRTNRSAMPYHPSRLVTSPTCYAETSLSLVGEETWWLDQAPPLPSQLNGAWRWSKGEVLDLFSESSCNETLLNDGMVFDSTLSVRLQKLQLLDDVGVLLIELAGSMHICKESPVVKVIDSVFKDGICCPVAP